MSDISTYFPHPRIAARKVAGPPKVSDVVVPAASAPWYARFNAWFAVKITEGVGTMWCDKRSEATYEDADAVLHTSLDIQKHLEAQDAEIEKILAEVRQLRTA